MHARLFILRKKSSLHALIKTLHDYSFLAKASEKWGFAQNRYKNTDFLLPYMVIGAYMIISFYKMTSPTRLFKTPRLLRSLEYSKDPNKSTCTAIYFLKKVRPIQAY